jgi:hypothetical protein
VRELFVCLEVATLVVVMLVARKYVHRDFRFRESKHLREDFRDEPLSTYACRVDSRDRGVRQTLSRAFTPGSSGQPIRSDLASAIPDPILLSPLAACDYYVGTPFSEGQSTSYHCSSGNAGTIAGNGTSSDWSTSSCDSSSAHFSGG